MRTLTLIIALTLTSVTHGQKIVGLAPADTSAFFLESTGYSQYDDYRETYKYEIESDFTPTEKEIQKVIDELTRVLIANGRALESYDFTIPKGKMYLEITAKNIHDHLVGISDYIGYRYIMGEYTIYFYNVNDFKAKLLTTGFMVDLTSKTINP